MTDQRPEHWPSEESEPPKACIKCRKEVSTFFYICRDCLPSEPEEKTPGLPISQEGHAVMSGAELRKSLKVRDHELNAQTRLLTQVVTAVERVEKAVLLLAEVAGVTAEVELKEGKKS